ncbi:MAG: ATP-binding cassette domain-containing protein [Chitinophagales bacterium]|jgi:ABC-type multidrug transport system ATPase subunit|nr:ATP-binding cassette domain-containing protein [Sphingobacteriales bacterium]
MHIRLEAIQKSYQKKLIFQNLSAEFESGKRYGIAGHNGSGKSTLLKILAGFITPNAGSVRFTLADKSIPVESVYKHINFVAPYIDLPTDLSFYELLDFHFSMKNRQRNANNNQINEYFQLPTELPIRQFSSGMLQRVKLALAFFTESDLVLLDEPTETLDDRGFELYATLLENLSNNRTVIIASNKDKDFIQCTSILRINDFTV